MAHYKVNTSQGLVEFDSPEGNLTSGEIEQVINDNLGGPAPQQASEPQPRPLSNLERMKQMAGQFAGGLVDNPIMRTLAIPDKVVGQSIQDIRRRLTPNLPPDKNNPSFIGETVGGLQALSRMALSPITGENALQAGSQEVTREKNQPSDIANQIAFSVLAPEVAGAPLNAAGAAISEVAPPVLKMAAGLSSVGTKNSLKNYETLFKNPEGILPGKMKEAASRYANEKEALGIPNQITPETIDQLKKPGVYALDLAKKMTSGEAVTPQEAQLGIESLNASYPIPNDKNKSYIRMLDKIKDGFRNIVNNASPEMTAASKDYAVAKAGESFKSLLPRNANGTPAYIRATTMLGNLAYGHPALSALGVPALAGAATAGLGTLSKYINVIAKNDSARRAILSSLVLGNKARGH